MKILRSKRIRRLLQKFYQKGYNKARKIYEGEIKDLRANQEKLIEYVQQKQRFLDNIEIKQLKKELKIFKKENKTMKKEHKQYMVLKDELETTAVKLRNEANFFQEGVTRLYQKSVCYHDTLQRVKERSEKIRGHSLR